MKTTAIVLAAGRGSRMNSDVKKQYLLLLGKPVVYYSLDAFEASPLVDEIVLVCGTGEEDECRREIVEKYGFQKVRAIVPGGKERYHSVFEGLKAAGKECGTVLIHDGARPMVDEAMIGRLLQEVSVSHACVAAMPVKDTVKLSGSDGFVAETLPRERLWMIQTPQVFDYSLIRNAYETVLEKADPEVKITDDAMVLESVGGRVRLVEGSYENLKITTPEDMILAESILKRRI